MRSQASVSSTKAPAALVDQRVHRTCHQVEAPQHPRHVGEDLVAQPVAAVGEEVALDLQQRPMVAARLQHDEADLLVVEAQLQQGIVELAPALQCPGAAAGLLVLGSVLRLRALGTVHGQRRLARARVDVQPDVGPGVGVAVAHALDRCQRDAVRRLRRGLRRELLGARHDPLGELRLLPRRVDQAPGDGLLAAHAFRHGAEHVGPVATDLALVDQPRQSPGAGQHAEQRHFGQ
jgi:hypothetical protein